MAVIKHHNQGNLETESFSWAYSSITIMVGMCGHGQVWLLKELRAHI